MEGSQSGVFTLLYVLWGFTTTVLIALLSYRATLLMGGNRTSIPATGTEQQHFHEERELIVRRSRLTGEIIALSVISGALLLTTVGFSIYYGSFRNF